MTTLRPKDLIEQLAISASTLRLWTEKFSSVLSPATQKSTTQSGGPAQRRFVQDDLDILKQAKRHLNDGKTYEETLAALQGQKPIPGPPEAPPAHKIPATELAVIETIHPLIRAFEEALKAKDQALAGKEETIEALHLVVRSKDNELQALQARIEELANRQDIQQPATQPATRFRWSFLNRLLTGGGQDVG